MACALFANSLPGAPNQLSVMPSVDVTAEQLLDLGATPGEITEEGLRANVAVGFQYVSFWLGGRGAAAINSLMEDAATAEISRTQLWQWVHHGVTLADGRTVTAELVRQVLDEETAKIHEQVGDEVWAAGRPDETRQVFESVALTEPLIEFLTLPAYELLD
jgi:malate synthase